MTNRNKRKVTFSGAHPINLDTRKRAKAVSTKIYHQFPKDHTGALTPEGMLAYRIVEQALVDLSYENYFEAEDARRFLRGDMWLIDLAGVNPDWIRLQIKKVGLSLDNPFRGMAARVAA